jgi:hypothetical protein
MFSPPLDALDCRQLYIDTIHFCHADEFAASLLIGHHRAIGTKFLHIQN